MICAEPPGDQHLHRPAQQLLPLVAEQRLGLGIDQPDRPGTVHDHHRIRGRLQQRTKPLLGIGLLACPGTAPAEQRHRSWMHRDVAASGSHGLTPRPMRAHRSRPHLPGQQDKPGEPGAVKTCRPAASRRR